MTAKFLRRALGLFIIAVLSSGLYGSNVYATDVEFQWSILAETKDGSMEGLDFSDMPVVHSGTALQIYLEHIENCHIYLYLLDSSNLLTPLYPTAPGYYNYGFPRGPKFIPPGDDSFAFVPPAGIETFYLIASVERQFQLEKLTEEFIKNIESPGMQKLLLTQIEDMLIGQLKRSKSADDREKIEVKVKTADGIKKKKFSGVEVDIADFYGRKLLIDHR
jgi:hypothetical protein